MAEQDPFIHARDTARQNGQYRGEGCGYPAGVAVFGPPAGTDGYRARNITLLRSRIFEAQRDRVDAQRNGEEATARVLSELISGWHRSLNDLGEPK